MKKFAFVGSVVGILLLLAVGRGIIGINFDYWNKLWGNLGGSRGPQPTQRQDGGSVRIVSEESVVVDVVKKVTPAVVTIGITKNQPIFDFDDPFGFGPFGGFLVPRQRGSQQIKQDIGSGFIVKSDGFIITNRHVVSDPKGKYRVVTADNQSFDVKSIDTDPDSDLAILKVEASNLPTVEMGDSGNLQVGQMAIAIGTALGEFRSTVTTGVISGLGRGIVAGSPLTGAEKLENVIQTSAAINPGNSGGPLLNSAGQVIGINVAVASGAENIGFALPINLVKDLLADFDSRGQFARKRAFLGVEYRMVTRELAILNEIPEGAYVQTVVEDSPAEKAGLERGDIITKFDGKNVRESEGGLAKLVSGKNPGDTIELTIFKGDNETKTVKVALGESPQ